MIGLSADINFGSYFNGELNSGPVSMRLSPSPHFSLTGTVNRNHFIKVGDNLETATADLWSITGRLALNPRLQLIGFYQRNSLSNQDNYNVRLSWEYQPLSYVYLVFNHRGFDNSLLKRQTEDHVIMKLSYLRQL